MKRTLVGAVVLGLVVAAVPSGSAIANPSGPAQETAAELPPGLSEEGVTDPLELVSAHRQALQNTSYTISTTFTYRRPNGTLLAQGTTATRVAPGGESYYATTTQTTRNETRPLGVEHYEVEVWANETTAVAARDLPDADPDYRRTPRSDAVMAPDGEWELLYAVLGAGDTELVGQLERDGTTLFRVVSTPEAAAESAELRYEFSALIDSRGIVHSIQVTQRTDIEGRPAVVTRSIQVTDVGETTVERPSWYGRATQNETA